MMVLNGISVSGVDEVLNAINNKLGKTRRERISRQAINKAGDLAEKDLKETTNTFRDTGQTTEQTAHSKARKIGGEVYQVKVGWGPGSRWRLEHLNEFGFIRNGRSFPPNGNIRGFGKLRLFAEEQKTVYLERITEELKELAK